MLRGISVWSDFLTTPEFLTGAFVSGVLSSGATYFTTRASDRRRAEQENKVLDRTEETENKRHNDQLMFDASTEFATVCSVIMVNAIDTKGVFNPMRDLINNASGMPDPQAIQKLMFSSSQMDEAKRIAVPFNKLPDLLRQSLASYRKHS